MRTILTILSFLLLSNVALAESAETVSVVGNSEVSSTGPTTITIQAPLGVTTDYIAFSESPALASIAAGVDVPANGLLMVDIDLSKLSDEQAQELRDHGKICIPIIFGPSFAPPEVVPNIVGTMKVKRLMSASRTSGTDNAAQQTSGNRAESDATKIDGGQNTSSTNGDPISMATREYFFYQRLLDLRGPTLPLTFDLYHGSQLGNTAFFDHLPTDFASNHHKSARKIDFFNGTFFQLQFHLGLGQIVSFERTPPETEWALTKGERWKFTVEETTDYYYLKDPNLQRVYIFKKFPQGSIVEPAFCLQVIDRHGNTLTYTLPADPTAEGPTSVTDSLGRTLSFTYGFVPGFKEDVRSYLASVQDHTGRQVTFTYEEVAGRVRLKSLTDTAGEVYQFAYDANHFMTGKVMPKGNTPYTQTQDPVEDLFGEGFLGAVATQTDAFGNVFTYEAGPGIPTLGDKQVILTNPDGTQAKHFHSEANVTTAIVDELGEKMLFFNDDANDQFSGVRDRDGGKITTTYLDQTGHLESFTNQRGETTTIIYTESAAQTFNNPEIAESVNCTFFDATRIEHPDATTHLFVRDGEGSAVSITDRDGDLTAVTYNGRGQILTRTNPEGGTGTFTYEAPTGLLDTSTDSDLGVTQYSYDSLSRLTQLVRPDGATMHFTYDALDRLVTGTDEDNILSRIDYDENSNVTSVTLGEGTPEAQQFLFGYDLLDRLMKFTDPTGSEITYEFPYFHRPIKATFADGATMTYQHDKRRALTRITDEASKVLQIGYSASEIIASFTSPEGRGTAVERDPLGVAIRTTDGSGDVREVALDVFSSPVSFSDGLGRKTTVVRDGERRITSRTEPRVGTTHYAYDDNGRLEKLTDAEGAEWDFTHTTMGRVLRMEDPDNRGEDRTYDNRGRLKTRTHPDGVVETWQYNPDSTLASRGFSDGLVHSYTYDALNRVTECTRSLGGQTETVSRSYDKRDLITSTSVNGRTSTATHDERHRLKTVTYPGGMVVTYTYDARGLVTRVEDSLTGSFIDYEYDDDRLLTKATRSNGRVTTYTYDAEGLPASVTHDNGATIVYTFNRADEPTNIADNGFPLDATPAFVDAVQTIAFNASSDIASAGFGNDSRGRRTSDPERASFVWDSDNRLIAVTKGVTTVNYRYDCQGRITARVEGGVETEYLYNDAIATTPIIGERRGGVYARFYVALPNGNIAYSVETPEGTVAARFYHFGKVGNTRYLTDAAGSVSDSYAYGAFGELLGQNGSSDQVFTFAGEFGVRDDRSVELSQMRHRYYDPESRRFLSRDPIFERLMTLLGLEANPFHYVMGRVTSMIDPTGLESSTVPKHLESLGFGDSDRSSVVLTLDQQVDRVIHNVAAATRSFNELAKLFSVNGKDEDQGLKGFAKVQEMIRDREASLHPVDLKILRAAQVGDRKALRQLLRGINGEKPIFATLLDDSEGKSIDVTGEQRTTESDFSTTPFFGLSLESKGTGDVFLFGNTGGVVHVLLFVLAMVALGLTRGKRTTNKQL